MGFVLLVMFFFILYQNLFYRYKGPDRHKLYGTILDSLYAKFGAEQLQFFLTRNGYGRALTGDGATVLRTKFINFLVYELGKGSMLCRIRDCTSRLAEVGTVESTYIAHEMIASARLLHVFNIVMFIYLVYLTHVHDVCQNGQSRNYLLR